MMHVCAAMGKVEEPPIPDFPYKYRNIPIVKDYDKELGDEYWNTWVKNEYSEKVNNWISWERLEQEAISSGYHNKRKLGRARDILVHGAELGCSGTGRMPSRMRNSPTVAGNGSKVADTLHGWVASGIVSGPFRESEMPFEEFKVSPMSVRPKPGGKIRLIIDLSAPHGVDSDSREANSVNKCINKSKLVTPMSSISEVCERIFHVGYPGEFAKADWNNAYKHISIKHEDRSLQVVHFAGRYFIENQMTFGSRSSPDRFDLVSDIPLEIALLNIKEDRNMTIKQLDDVAAFGLIGTGVVGRFYEEYRAVCSRVGISLAGEEDQEKAFGPRTVGVILGVIFDLSTMKWSIPVEKGDRMLTLLWVAHEEGKVGRKTWERICGKINHYKCLVKFGKWERSWILAPLAREGALEDIMLGAIAKEQIKWWIASIQLAKVGSAIPDPRGVTPRVTLEMYPDAAGMTEGEGAGLGSWFMTSKQQPWIQMAWPELAGGGTTNSRGVSFSSKLTTLEALAALVGFVSEPDLVRNKSVLIKTDNIGFMYAYDKGHSKCEYAHSVCKALHYVAESLNSTLVVVKTPRRSGVGEVVADELSKGNIERAMELMTDAMPSRSYCPRVLGEWISNPYPTRCLGEAIVDELAEFTSVLEWGQF